MKKSELVLLILYMVFTVAVFNSVEYFLYTPKVVFGGCMITFFLIASCGLREKAEEMEYEEKSLQYNRLAFAFQVISWLLFAFYLAMVVVGF